MQRAENILQIIYHLKWAFSVSIISTSLRFLKVYNSISGKLSIPIFLFLFVQFSFLTLYLVVPLVTLCLSLLLVCQDIFTQASWSQGMIFLAVSHLCVSLFPPLLNAQSAFLHCLLILLLRKFTTHHVMISTLYVLDAVFPTEPALPGQRPIKFAVLFFYLNSVRMLFRL